jgi:carbon storage regulator
MLVITRKPSQSFMVGDDVRISIISVGAGKVRIGIQAPDDVPIFRSEIYCETNGQATPWEASSAV